MAPKHKGEEKAKCQKSCCQENQSTSLFLLKGQSAEDLEIVKLKHPGTQKPALFVFSEKNNNICELTTFSDSYRSYFIDDTVKSNGNLYLMTAVDPLFLVLPYLASSAHCSPLDQILRDDDCPDIERLSDNHRLKNNIIKISDKKGTNIVGYKYNEEKTLSWLQTKVNKTCNALTGQSVQVSNSSSVVSNNFIKHSVPTHESKENYVRCAFGIVCEYLPADLKQKLQTRLNITEPERQTSVNAKRSRSTSSDNHKTNAENTDDNSEKQNKKSKTSPCKINKENAAKLKTPVISAKEKGRIKAAVGSKSISSFFKRMSS